MTYLPKTYRKQGGDEFVVASGGKITAEAGGTIQQAAVAAGSALTLTRDAHDGKTILLDTAAGSTVTLPASSGSGMRFRFVISVVPTSNSHIVKVANATDVMSGVIVTAQDAADTAVAWETASTSDTITLNRTTTGGTIIGEWVEIEDVVSGTWAVRGCTAATGTEATPFSATVA